MRHRPISPVPLQSSPPHPAPAQPMGTRTGTLALPEHGLRALGPGVLAAVSFGCSDIFTKLALLSGMDALTLAAYRGVLGTLFVLAWLRAAPPRRTHSKRQRLIALGVGLLFAANLYLLFAAIRMVAVPIAILSYFVYPLLTGIVGAAIGLERLPLVSAAAAVVALLGLALMLGADTAHLAWLGVGLAIGAACCRVATLLVTRAALSQADSRLTTWYSMLSSTAVLLAASVVLGAPTLPQTGAGWVGFFGVCVCSTISILALFASTVRIGAFRTALIMNLEPVVSTLLSIVVLHEVLAPLQFLGGAIMVLALCAFQVRRG
jgi:drug/metabolite transporter (DMT)-like permease